MTRPLSKIGSIQVFFLLLAIITGLSDMVCSTPEFTSGIWIAIVDLGTILITGALISPFIYGLTKMLRPRTIEIINKKTKELFITGPKNSHSAIKILSFEIGATSLYVITTYIYFITINAVRTDIYRSMAIALFVVFASFVSYIIYLTLSEVLIRAFDWLKQRRPWAKTVINTYTVAMISILAFLIGVLTSPPLIKAIKTTGYCLPATILVTPLLTLAILLVIRKLSWSGLRELAGVWVYYGLSLLFVIIFLFATPGDKARTAIANGNISRLCYQAIEISTDFDNDGQSSLLGDGDCAPWNPNIFSGAPEIPGNGKDENCDGQDMKKSDTLGKSKWDFPLPSKWTAKKRSIVLITVDAWNASRCSFNGYKRQTTPFLNKFIKKCVYFNAAFSQGPSTRLSFPSTFTSKFDPEIKRAPTRRIPYEILPSNTMLAEIMKSEGFKTIAVLPTKYFKNWKGLTRGFDVVDTGAVSSWRKPAWHNGKKVATRAIIQINKEKSHQLFMWVHIYDTHGPHVQPPKTIKFGKSEPDHYDAEVLYVDRQIKRIITTARKKLGKDTLFILTADHGESFDWRHKRKHHAADIYTTVVHVPLFFCNPALTHGRREQLASLLDIFPTLVNLFPYKGKKTLSFRGTSLAPALFDPTAKTSDRVFQTMFLPEKAEKHQKSLWWVGVINQKYDLIWDLRHNAFQAFNWRTDIHDRSDIYFSHKKILRPLVNALSVLISKTMPKKSRYQVR